jgi:hypothetical protein
LTTTPRPDGVAGVRDCASVGKGAMRVADVLRYLVIVGLGVLSVVTFLVAGTITGLMIFDDGNCKFCDSYPIGLWTLGLLGGLFTYSMVQVAIDKAPEVISKMKPVKRENLVLAGIIFVFFIIIFIH